MDNKKIFGIFIAFLLLVWTIIPASRPLGAAPSGLTATVATSSQASVGTTATTVFATSTNCSARVISTVEKPIMLIFSNYKGETPSGVYGYLQAASTTTIYDAEIFGCNALKVYGFDSSTTLTIMETR